MKPSIALVYFNAGGGHRAAALALQEAMLKQGRPWDVQLVNLFEVLDPKGRFLRITGIRPEDIYNKRLARGWTLGMAQELKVLQRLIRLCHGTLVSTLQQYWLQSEPDLVVSLVPNFNRALCESVNSSMPGVPYLTVMTDLADLPPNFWIEPGVTNQQIVCGTPQALAQARAAGCAPERLTLSSGMVLRPSFYEATPDPAAERRAGRIELGLDPDAPTGIVMFGGHGSLQMLKIARSLGDRQMIFMCGYNKALIEKLKLQGSAAPHAAVGFTSEVARHLRLADYFIGKPGPGCLSEAVHMGLPVITSCGVGTLPQERYNAQWVQETGVGLVLPSMRAIASGVDDLIARLPEFQAGVAKNHNRAVFEIPELFAQLMQRAAMPGEADLRGLAALGA